MAKMSRGEWNKTPYANTSASDPDHAIRALLGKYDVFNIQMTECLVYGKRPAVLLRFELKGKTYRVPVITLEADVERDRLVRQAKRAVYFILKSTLEAAEVFFTPEEVLFAFLEVRAATGEETTCYEAARPYMARLQPSDFGRLMIGPTRSGGDEAAGG